jgi:hypothetical protein
MKLRVDPIVSEKVVKLGHEPMRGRCQLVEVDPSKYTSVDDAWITDLIEKPLARTQTNLRRVDVAPDEQWLRHAEVEQTAGETLDCLHVSRDYGQPGLVVSYMSVVSYQEEATHPVESGVDGIAVLTGEEVGAVFVAAVDHDRATETRERWPVRIVVLDAKVEEHRSEFLRFAEKSVRSLQRGLSLSYRETFA